MNSKSLNNQGFTILEVLISIFLLVIISLGIYQATTESYRLREILAAEADFYGGIRLSMNALDRDITMLYTPKIMLPPSTLRKADPANAPAAPISGTGQTDNLDAQDQQAIVFGDREKGTQFWTSVIDKTGIRMTHFIGTEFGVSFVSASNLRVYRDSRESMFAKVKFELADEKNPEPEYQGTKTLVKQVNVNAFNIESDDDSFTRRYPLLRGIQAVKFGYYNREKDVWFNTWDSDSADFKGTYPDAIRLEIKLIGPQNMKFEGLFKFRPETPINGLYPTT